MMKKNYKNLLGSILALGFVAFASMNIMAQNVISSEEFDGGFPDGWVSADASGGNAEWTWCGDPIGGVGAGCVAKWNTYSNQHDGVFSSTTAANGFMVMDSDGLAAVSPNHQATLTMPAADYSGQTEVWLKFEALIGVFGLPTAGNVLTRVSTDGGTTWEEFELMDKFLHNISIAAGNTGQSIPGEVRFTENGQIFITDISSIAAGKSDVLIQFWWEGNYEYYYLLDDVVVYDADPRLLFFEKHNIKIDNFYTIAPNAQTPGDQVVEMSFLTDVTNDGLLSASNVVTTISIVDDATSEEVFSSTLNMGDILPDTLNQNTPFPDKFTPPSTPATYTATYSTVSDSTDEKPENNSRVFNFSITDNIFAKENAPTFSLAPNGAEDNTSWDPAENRSWGIGNFFKTPNGAGRYATKIWFGINNAEEVTGETVFLKLYAWTDANSDNIPSQDELTTLSNSFYDITGQEVANELFSVDLLDNTGSNLGEIELTDGGQYIAMMEYIGADNMHSLNISGAQTLDNQAQIFQDTMINGMDAPYYTYFLAINDPITEDTWNSSGFGTDLQPSIRLEIADTPLQTATENLFSNKEIFLSPNPATSYIQLNVNLEAVAQDAHVSIISASGQRVTFKNEGAVQNNSFTYDVTDLAAGQYFIVLKTDQGSAMRPFSVVK